MKFIIRLFVVFGLVVLSACNTWEGIKKDSNEAGEAIGEAGKAIGEAAENAGKSIQEAAE